MWTASMSGTPWSKDKMDDAVAHLRRRATIVFTAGQDTMEDLLALDTHVFARRPDLILFVANTAVNGRYPEPLLQALAGLQHVAALKLDIRQQQHLQELGALSNLEFLQLHAAKKISLDFIRNYKRLNYLALSGKFEDLSPIADIAMLTSLNLNCPVERLDFIADLPSMAYLALDSCTLNDSLDKLAYSPIHILRLSSVRNLTDISAVAALRNLAFLQLALPKVERLCDFSTMSKLKQLELCNMKSLQEIDALWTAYHVERLELNEISKAIKAEDLANMAYMPSLRQVDFRFIDSNKGRITALNQHFHNLGKEGLLYDNIPEAERIPSMAIAHLSNILM